MTRPAAKARLKAVMWEMECFKNIMPQVLRMTKEMERRFICARRGHFDLRDTLFGSTLTVLTL